MLSWHGYLFRGVEYFWCNLRRFCFNNRTIFEILFILLYALEQILLILFIFYIEDNQRLLSLVVSLFGILVLTTFALHKVLMESRIKTLEQDLTDVQEEKIALELKTKEIINKYNEVTENINEHITKTFK